MTNLLQMLNRVEKWLTRIEARPVMTLYLAADGTLRDSGGIYYNAANLRYLREHYRVRIVRDGGGDTAATAGHSGNNNPYE